MPIYLKQSTASQEVPLGYFLDSTDGNTEETGLTIANTDIKIWKTGATTLANKNSGGATHISNGVYYATLDATDTNTLGPMVIFCHPTGALATRTECVVLAANIYDALIGGGDTLQVDLTQISGSAVSTTTAQLGVNIVQVSEDATAATNMESFFDGTGYAGTNNVIPTVTTLTGHTAQTGDNYARLGAPAGASVSADIAAIEAQTDDIGAAGAGLTAVPWNASWDAEVQSEVNDALVALGLDHLVGAAVTGTDITDDSIIAQLVSSSATADWDSYDNTSDSLQSIRDRGDAAWTTGAAGSGLTPLASGTAQGGTSSTIQLAAGESFGDDILNGAVVKITGGTGAGQHAVITDYTGATDTATTSPSWVTSPDATSTYEIVDGYGYMAAIVAGLIDATAIATDAIDADALAADAIAEINATVDAAISDAALATAAALATVDGNVDTILTGTAAIKYSGEYGPGVYLDDSAANTGTTTGTDGTIDNPVSTLAAARTIADAIGVQTYYIYGNSTFTLAATHEDWTFVGEGEIESNVINLGSQDVDRSRFINLCIEGTQGGTQRIQAIDCCLQDPGVGDTTLNIFALRCGIKDRIQVDTSADNVFAECYSLVAGTAAPIIQATGASGTISVRRYSGGIEFESLSASHNVSVETDGQVVFDATCNVAATVVLRGNMTVTDNTAGMQNVTQDAVYNRAAVNAEADTAISDAALATASALATVDANVDAILTDTGTTLPATLGTPAGADLATDIASIQTDTTAIVADTNELQVDWANGGRLDLILDELTTQGDTNEAKLDTIDSVVDAILVDTAALADSALPDSIPADGSIPTLRQAVYMVVQYLNERAVAGTTVTVKKVDGSTTLYTQTLDAGVDPTSVTRAT